MNIYTPNSWIVLRFTTPENIVTEKVFAGWYGGYTNGDSWRLNSGNEYVDEFDDRYEFKGFSGSIYVCYKYCQGMSMYQSSLYSSWINNTIPEGTKMEIIKYE